MVPPPGYRCNHVTSHMRRRDTTFPWFKGLVQRQSCDSRQPIRILLGTNLWMLLEKGYSGRFVACNRCTTLVEDIYRKGLKARGIWELCISHYILLGLTVFGGSWKGVGKIFFLFLSRNIMFPMEVDRHEVNHI